MDILEDARKFKTKVTREWLDRSHVDMHSWGDVKSVHHGDYCSKSHPTRDGTRALADLGSSVISTTTDTGLTTLAHTAASGGSVAISGAGYVAVPLAGAVAIGKSVAAGVSVYKSQQHINKLQYILERGRSHGFCEGKPDEHNYIFDHVLPYIIEQKKRKLRRKAEQTVPVLGSVVSSIETGIHGAWKRARGTRSKERHFEAQMLTVHLVSCECDCTEEIVSELWGKEKMKSIRGMNSNEAGPYIFSKMASE